MPVTPSFVVQSTSVLVFGSVNTNRPCGVPELPPVPSVTNGIGVADWANLVAEISFCFV